jgi:alkylation response protein AidB-like acyl-CoA dehydrogenase
MELMPNDEQDAIATTVAAFLADRLPVQGRGRDHVTHGPELADEVWRDCAELGWLSLGLPAANGGVGYSLVEEMVLFRELGRAVAPGPFLPGVLAGHLAVAAGDQALAASIMSGEVRVALGTAVGPASIGSVVSGDLSLVHTDRADHVLVCDDQHAALIPARGLDIRPVDAVDGSISTGRCRPDGVPTTLSAPARDEPVWLRGLVLAAAEAAGVAAAVLDLAVAHAGDRVQFGRPIGTYQAIKHRCADMKVAADGADAQTAYAAVAVRDGIHGAATEAIVAKYVADEAARTNSEGAVQIHGAMGFTSEALPHRYVYRAHLLGRCLATRTTLLDQIVRRDAAGEQ